jgi:formate/nitrite transporter FocA (FNT family)
MAAAAAARHATMTHAIKTVFVRSAMDGAFCGFFVCLSFL